ncbi:MAG: zf-HC2 domain-containing protein [Chloroflexi bacterium]|nr:zf-HC2 domain-containing protein [Chloroflexota bacterium]MDL1884866.1 zf-HC2 domain-containing protein [Anaerolineae bacterium CFX8]
MNEDDPMDCETLIHYLSDYIDNNLSESLAEEARQHLATCKNCHVVLDTTQRTILLYRQRGQQQGLSPRRHAALYDRLEKALVARPAEDCE